MVLFNLFWNTYFNLLDCYIFQSLKTNWYLMWLHFLSNHLSNLRFNAILSSTLAQTFLGRLRSGIFPQLEQSKITVPDFDMIMCRCVSQYGPTTSWALASQGESHPLSGPPLPWSCLTASVPSGSVMDDSSHNSLMYNSFLLKKTLGLCGLAIILVYISYTALSKCVAGVRFDQYLDMSFYLCSRLFWWGRSGFV